MSIHATKALQAYWKENLVIISVLLSIWFAVSYLCGILLANPVSYTHLNSSASMRLAAPS